MAKKGEEENTPAFADADRKEVSIAEYRCMLKKNVEDAGLGNAYIKVHSRCIGGSTAYANSP